MVTRRALHRLHEHARRQAAPTALPDGRRRQRAAPGRRAARKLVYAQLVALTVLLLLVLAGTSRAETVSATDLRYFADATPGVAAGVEWVLQILVSHPRKPSRGFRRLPFQPEADADLEPAIDCQRLEPVPRARPHQRRAALEGFEVCGVRLLHWSLGDVDRIDLAAVAQKTAGGKRWVQVLVDPSINRRAWLQFSAGKSGEPLMRVRPLGDWIASALRGVVPGHATRLLMLRSGPSDAGEPAPLQLSKDGGDVPVDVLGVQGDWVRLSAQDPACERDSSDDAACASGWTRWRSDDGQPIVLP